MLKNRRLGYIWFVLAATALFVSSPAGSRWVGQAAGQFGMNDWVHFLAYATVVALSLAAWKKRSGILLSCTFAALGLGLQLSALLFASTGTNFENVLSDLFGTVGGLRLGLNLRMFTPAKSSDHPVVDPTRLPIP